MQNQHDLSRQLPSELPMGRAQQAAHNKEEGSCCTPHKVRKLGAVFSCLAGAGTTNCDQYIAPLCGLDPDSILGSVISGGAFTIPLHASLIAGMIEVHAHSTELTSVHESFQIRFMEFVEKVDASHHVSEDQKKALLALAKMSQTFFQEIIDEKKEHHSAMLFYITTLSTMAVLTAVAMTPAAITLPFLSASAANIVQGVLVTGIGTLPVMLQTKTTHHYQELFYKVKDFPAQFEAWTHMLEVILADEQHPQHDLLTKTLEESRISTEKSNEVYQHLAEFMSGLYSLDKLTSLKGQGTPTTSSMGGSSRSTREILRSLSSQSISSLTESPSPTKSVFDSPTSATSPTSVVSTIFLPGSPMDNEAALFVPILALEKAPAKQTGINRTSFYPPHPSNSQRTTPTPAWQ